jgi:DNA (cytosine-5)-methyltransferase 1
MDNVINGCALASDDRSFRELCYLQGLSDTYDLPEFNLKGKKKAVGNGVPLSIGNILASAVLNVTGPGTESVNDLVKKNVTVQANIKRCACGCQRVITGRKRTASDTCRKRMQRLRDKLHHQSL